MKKNKEWLKNEILGLSIKARHKENNQREWHMGHEMALFDVNKLIDQLDEPKTLSQEWLDENVVEGDFRGEQEFWYGRFIEEEKVKNLLVPKQEKIVIPQFVADWYEENLSGGYTNNRNKFSGNDVFRVTQDVFKTIEGIKTWGDYGIDDKIAAWVEENEEDFIHLIANCSYKDGYEVEKEILWEIPLPDLKTTGGHIQYLTYDPKARTYFASRQNGRLKQTFNAKDLASVPTLYRHYGVLCDFNKIEEVKE